jgi:type I restriction enzyme, S subunit
LIELLKEKHQALISHCVTKGLNPNAKMKDSGVKWLGEIPVGWGFSKFKYHGYIRYGLSQPPPYYEQGQLFIRATDIKGGTIKLDNVKLVKLEDLPVSRNLFLKAGDIIVVRSGAYTGDSAIITEECSDAILGFDMALTLPGLESHFYSYFLLSCSVFEGQFKLLTDRAAQPHLNASELGDTHIPLPPIHEQNAIAVFLDQETQKIDTLIEKATSAITLLKERRTALISAAVTGKIDIRDQVKPEEIQ